MTRILLYLVLMPAFMNAQDSTASFQQISWRIGVGAGKLYSAFVSKNRDYPHHRSTLSLIDAGEFEIGLKINGIDKPYFNCGAELNYLVSYSHLRYSSWDYGRGGGSSYTGDYASLLNTAQFHLQFNFTPDKYLISFGPYINVSFCEIRNGKGEATHSAYSTYDTEYLSYKNESSWGTLPSLGGILSIARDFKKNNREFTVGIRFKNGLTPNISPGMRLNTVSVYIVIPGEVVQINGA